MTGDYATTGHRLRERSYRCVHDIPVLDFLPRLGCAGWGFERTAVRTSEHVRDEAGDLQIGRPDDGRLWRRQATARPERRTGGDFGCGDGGGPAGGGVASTGEEQLESRGASKDTISGSFGGLGYRRGRTGGTRGDMGF